MKSIKILAYVSAVALMGMGLASCNNNDPEKTNEVARESVKTQFSISLPQQLNGSAARKMPGTAVQADNNFRGITDLVLLPFDLADASASAPVASTDATQGNFFTLASIDAVAATNNSKVYNDVQIPVGVNAFLLYGKANDNPSDNAGWQQFGVLNVTGLTNPVDLSAVEFTPKAIYETAGTPAKATAIAEYLTDIAQAKTAANVYWYTVAATDTKLGTLYTDFTKQTAGSSFSVQTVVTSLYKQMKLYADDASNLNIAVAEAVMAAIETKATVSSGEITGFDATLNDYPEDIYLPDGAAVLAYSETTHEFSAVTDKNTLNADNHTALQAYTYPANLYYFVNSGLVASDAKQSDNYTGKDWAGVLALYTDNEVKVTTRSIAMKNQINYGVARLDVSVRALDATVKDNSATPKDINVSNLKVNGVLVGVKKTAGWDFKPLNTNPVTIYDVLDSPADITVNASDHGAAVNYTLLTENTADEKVNIAIEFINNDATFTGENGQIIPKGGKFYLVGVLEPGTGEQVFKQDFNTKARFTINDLTKAYNLIPDLQVPELELGLSVNLTWQEGLTLDVTL